LTNKKKLKPIWRLNSVKRITIKNLFDFYGGPINCITIKKNKIEGTNTDRLGFTEAYSTHVEKKTKEEGRRRVPNGKALVIGFGGAAKSIISSLVEMNFDTIMVFNRTFEKIKNIGVEIYETESTSSLPMCEIIPEKIDNLINHTNYNKSKNTELIVNTSPTNILNNKTKWNIGGDVVGFDIVYKPREGTGFLSNFNPKRRIEGVEMLVYQAAPCFKLWFGIEPKVDYGIFKYLYKKLEQDK
jgi:shikimate dehydrogenase